MTTTINKLQSTMDMKRMAATTPYIVNTETGKVIPAPIDLDSRRSQIFQRKNWEPFMKFTFEMMKQGRKVTEFINSNGIDEQIAQGLNQLDAYATEIKELKAKLEVAESKPAPKKVAKKVREPMPVEKAINNSVKKTANNTLREAVKNESISK